MTATATRPGKTVASVLGTGAAPAPVDGPGVRLGDSPLWRRQRDFYTGSVPDIWGTATAPHAITANPRIAHTYARVAAEFLRSARNLAAGAQIIEVGAGSGRFAHLFVRALRALAPDLAFRYVLTDYCAERVAAWREHPQLAGLAREGVVDFAVLDADAPAPLELAVSGDRLTPGALDAAVLVIANYVLDTLRHDGYAIRSGVAHDLLLAVPDDPAAGRGEWDLAPLGPLTPELAALLDHYAATLDDTTLLVPTGGMQVLDHLRSLTSGPVCTLVADKGHTLASELCGQVAPAVVFHGSAFSMMVNFDALARWVRARGGTAVLPAEPSRHLVVAAFVDHDADGRLAHLPALVRDALADIGPDTWFQLRQAFRGHPQPALDDLLAVLRLSRFDPSVFVEHLPQLLATLPGTPDVRRGEVARTLAQVRDAWFDIGEPVDLDLCLGAAYGAIAFWPEAARHFELSVRAHPDSADAALALASAHRGLRDLPAAVRWTERALELQPGLADARALRVQLAEEVG